MIPINIPDNTTLIMLLFLRKLGVPVTRGFLLKEVQSHPFYPSLAAVSDILNLYKVENSAMRISIDEIDKVPLPFIVHLSLQQGTFAIVEKISATEINLAMDEKISRVFSMEDFIKIWDNVILTASITKKSGEPNYAQNQKNELIATVKLPLIIISTVLILIFSLVLNQSTLHYIPLFITKCIGMFFIWLLIKHELGLHSDLTDKLCTMSKSVGCNEVLNSKASKLFGVIHLADIGLVWFISSFIFLLTSSFQGIDEQSLNILGLISILSLPFILFSLGYQVFIVKKYCPLCIGVMSMLLTEIILFITYYHFSFQLPAISSLLLLVSILSVVVYVWSVIKPYLMERKMHKDIEIQYLHLRRNPIVISSILAQGTDYSILKIPGPFRITNNESDIIITEIINPFCNPCKIAFAKAQQLINETNGQSPVIQFVFMTQTDNQDNIMTKTAMHMLAFAEGNTPEKIEKALSEWFKTLNYEKWSEKYPVKIEESHYTTLKKQFKWCIENNIEGTPTTFVNSKLLPSKTDLIDLKYILD